MKLRRSLLPALVAVACLFCVGARSAPWSPGCTGLDESAPAVARLGAPWDGAANCGGVPLPPMAEPGEADGTPATHAWLATRSESAALLAELLAADAMPARFELLVADASGRADASPFTVDMSPPEAGLPALLDAEPAEDAAADFGLRLLERGAWLVLLLGGAAVTGWGVLRV